MRLFDLRRQAEGRLAAAKIPEAKFEIALLFEHMFCYNRTDLLAKRDEEISQEDCARFLALVGKRERGYPLQYLLGEWEFYGLPFFVGEGVLVPRPETELLVDTCLTKMKGRKNPEIVDFCSGSGCIAVALERNLIGARVTAVELSREAFCYLEKNAVRHGGKVNPVLGDALAYEAQAGSLDLAVSNPPYIPAEEKSLMSKETAYEPSMALFAGEGGLSFYRALAARCYPMLKPGGVLAFETGFSQGKAVANLLEQAGYREIEIRRDYAGHERVVTGIR